jgi:glycosyltransferase involved in cell wall biosynthesis
VDALSALSRRDTHLVMACRAKTAGARQAEAELRAHAEAAGVAASITWLGETPHIHALLSAADVVSLPSVDLYAKMDYPLVLLEAMSLGRPVIVARTSAAAELAQGDAARCVDASAEAVAAELEGLLDDAEAMRALGARAALAVQERYHYRVMARAYEAVYDTLLAM